MTTTVPVTVSVAPATAPRFQRLKLRIVGANFVASPALCVRISGGKERRVLPVTLVSEGELEVDVPACESDRVFVCVSNDGIRYSPEHAGAAVAFFTLASVSPPCCTAGSLVQLSVGGANFPPDAAAVVRLTWRGGGGGGGSVDCPAAMALDGTVRCDVLMPALPTGSAAERAHITVSFDGGEHFAEDPLALQVARMPAAYGAQPRVLLSDGSSTLRIHGRGFETAASTITVRFWSDDPAFDQRVPARALSSRLLECAAPAFPGAQCAVWVDVSLDGQHFTTDCVALLVLHPARATAVTPPCASLTGGDAVAVAGADLVNAGALRVRFRSDSHAAVVPARVLAAQSVRAVGWQLDAARAALLAARDVRTLQGIELQRADAAAAALPPPHRRALRIMRRTAAFARLLCLRRERLRHDGAGSDGAGSCGASGNGASGEGVVSSDWQVAWRAATTRVLQQAAAAVGAARRAGWNSELWCCVPPWPVPEAVQVEVAADGVSFSGFGPPFRFLPAFNMDRLPAETEAVPAAEAAAPAGAAASDARPSQWPVPAGALRCGPCGGGTEVVLSGRGLVNVGAARVRLCAVDVALWQVRGIASQRRVGHAPAC